MKSISKYTSCRDFLKALLNEAKESNPHFTVENLADKLGLSTSNLKMILTGKRNLSIHSALTVADSLKFSKSEVEYFELIALKEKNGNLIVKNHFNKRALVAKKALSLSTVSISSRELIEEQYTLPILVFLTDICDKKRDLDHLSTADILEISKKFKLDEKTCRKVLEKINLARLPKEKNSGEEIHYSFNHLTATISQKEYLKNWLNESKKKIETDYDNPRTLFNATTLSLSPEDLIELKLEMKSLLQKYLSKPPGLSKKTVLAQMNTQLFSILEP